VLTKESKLEMENSEENTVIRILEPEK